MSTAPAPEGAPEALWRRIIGPPTTRAGRWSAWLVGGVIGVLAAVGGLVAAGAPDLGWPALILLVLSSAVGVLVAIVAGIIALSAVREGERSIIIAGPLLFGVVCFLFVAGLVVSPA
jgi:hypothetical protein